MTDSAIIAASYAAERNYSHNPDDVIDPSGAVLAIGTEKVNTTTLKDRSLNNNDGTIHGAMPTEGFIQGRRFDGDDDYLATTTSIPKTTGATLIAIFKTNSAHTNSHAGIVDSGVDIFSMYMRNNLIIGRYNDSVGAKLVSTTYISNHDEITICHVVDTQSELKIYINGVLKNSVNTDGRLNNSTHINIGKSIDYVDGLIYHSSVLLDDMSLSEIQQYVNTLARLPFWSVNYTDYPDNVTEYTDNLPYSSNIISSGTFKVDDDKLQCISAGTITYSASYEFDGSEYIKVEIGGVVYAGTGTITQGNTTVSVAQGSNKITIQTGTGDTIDKVDIQFRVEV